MEKLLPAFQQLCHFQVSQVAICFVNPKTYFAGPFLVFAHLMCQPCCFAEVCVCVCWGGSHLFGDMLWYCILQELSPVLTGESNAKQHIHMSFRGRESSLSR